MTLRSSIVAALALTLLAMAPAFAQQTNLLALGEGTLPVVAAANYGGWPAANMLDDSPSSGWACEDGKIANNVFVFEMVAPATLTAFEFDTASIDTDHSGAKDVLVEVSTTAKNAGFRQVLRATLEDRKDGQRFPATSRVEGRWVRLTIADNHGSEQWTELMGFRGYGTKPAAGPPAPIGGTYQTSYNDFHLRRQGSAISGCYNYNDGLFEGSVEGRVAKLTWSENSGNSKGPAVFVFSPDGASFTGYWWHDTDKGQPPSGDWTGTRSSTEVGSCPHWSGSVGGEVKKDLEATGRARLYGILFDTDSARLRPESFAVLDEVLRVLNGDPGLSLTIEGHTDSSGTAAHNQTLSEERAKAVKDYLVDKGIAANRLATVGYGQSRPVADNATELGRAANRRVELVKR
jgi:outer membrane protein OmpA-like peptidoglycan-associated protein